MPLGGTSMDVFVFDLALSVGDISENEINMSRQRVLETLCSTYPEGKNMLSI